MAERAKRSIQEDAQNNSVMGGSRVYQGIQYGRGQKSSNTTCSMFAEHRAKLTQQWNKKGSISLDQALLMYEMFDPSTSRSTQVACAADIKTKNYKENRKRGYEGQI